METTKKSWYKRLGWTGVALCGLCCALPLIGTAVGMASLTALSVYLEKIWILALGLAAFFFWYDWYSKRKKAKACATSCETNCECKPEASTQSK
jgi:membrane protein implicated in regulation of membrane protease activity